MDDDVTFAAAYEIEVSLTRLRRPARGLRIETEGVPVAQDDVIGFKGLRRKPAGGFRDVDGKPASVFQDGLQLWGRRSPIVVVLAAQDEHADRIGIGKNAESSRQADEKGQNGRDEHSGSCRGPYSPGHLPAPSRHLYNPGSQPG